jgi:hypothetical protein
VPHDIILRQKRFSWHQCGGSNVIAKNFDPLICKRPTNRAFRSFLTREKVCPLTGKLRGPRDEGYSSF